MCIGWGEPMIRNSSIWRACTIPRSSLSSVESFCSCGLNIRELYEYLSFCFVHLIGIRQRLIQ